MQTTPYGKLSAPDLICCGSCGAEFTDPLSQDFVTFSVTAPVTGISNVGGLEGSQPPVCPKCGNTEHHHILRLGHLEVPAPEPHDFKKG